MSRRERNLTQLLVELQARYGSNDPMVLEVQKELVACQDRGSEVLQRTAPFSERRSSGSGAHYSTVKPRKFLHPATRQEIISASNRADFESIQ